MELKTCVMKFLHIVLRDCYKQQASIFCGTMRETKFSDAKKCDPIEKKFNTLCHSNFPTIS